MLPRVMSVLSLGLDDEGAAGATFADDSGQELRVIVPPAGPPVLQRVVPHRYTDKFTGDHHAYATREDTPLSWEDAARLVDAMEPLRSDGQADGYAALVRELGRRARADAAWCPDPELRALLHSTAEPLFPSALADRLVTLASRATDGDSPLHVLLWRRDVEGARRLVAAGAAVNVAGDVGDTPLHVALRMESVDAASMLLAAGADPDAPNLFGATPRQMAYKTTGAMSDCFRAAGFDPPPPSSSPVDAPR